MSKLNDQDANLPPTIYILCGYCGVTTEPRAASLDPNELEAILEEEEWVYEYGMDIYRIWTV